MPLKRKMLLPLSGISLASPQHITLHLTQKCINRVSPIQSTISCTVSLITYTVLLSVSCNDGVFSSELITKTMHLSFHLCYKSYVSQTQVEHFFRSGNHTHICFKKTFPWLSPMLNIHLLPSVVLPALNNRPDIQKCQKNLIWKRVSFLWLLNYNDICGSPFTVFCKWLSKTVRPPKANS